MFFFVGHRIGLIFFPSFFLIFTCLESTHTKTERVLRKKKIVRSRRKRRKHRHHYRIIIIIMADEEEKKEDKGEHINLKVKDQVPFFVARSFFSRAKERERELFAFCSFFSRRRLFKNETQRRRRSDDVNDVLVEHD